MTRESKVAIILGFAVVLVVAALISDHFSHARLAKLDNSITAGTPKDFGAHAAGLSMPIGNTQPMLVNEPLDKTGPARADSAAAGDRSGAKPAGPASIEMGTPAAREKEHGKETPGGKPGEKPGVVPAEGDGSSSDDASTPPERAIAGSDLPFTDEKPKSYQVKENDSLYRIAKSMYGDGSLWQELAEYNKGKVGANNGLRAGATITVPPKKVLLGQARLRPVEPAGKKTPARSVALGGERPIIPGDPGKKPADKASEKSEKSRASAANAPKHMAYTVRKGDHLSSIAQRLLGSAGRMDEILKLNPSLDDEDSIREGLVIRVPAK